METDCDVCLSVAHGGRIRVTEESSSLLIALLRQARRESLRARRAALESGADDEKREADAAIRTIKSLAEEIQRTQTEKGWPNGQLQQRHS